MAAETRPEPNLKSLPIACTLTPGDLQERLALIRGLTAEALLGHDRHGLVLALRYASEAVERVRAIVASEQQCCAFLNFEGPRAARRRARDDYSAGERARRRRRVVRPVHRRWPSGSMSTPIVYVLASVGEIAGCFSFWAWLRLGKSPLWLLLGMASLALFAYLLTRIDTATAARAYAAYGSGYIVSSICWLWAVEGARPDRWDVIGAGVVLVGASIIVFAVRS
jgi:small multidrug resistance family-3 protein